MSSERGWKGRKAFALVAVAIMLAVPFCVLQESDEVEEDDAILPVPLIVEGGILLAGQLYEYLIAIGVIAGAAATAGVFIGMNINDNSSSDAQEKREDESTLVFENMQIGRDYYKNALAQLDTIWSLTQEHFIRQSELVASSIWEEGSEYNPDPILLYSDTYTNSAMMLSNSSIQINQHLHQLEQRMLKWHEYETYRGHMELGIRLDNTEFSSSTKWDLHFASIVESAMDTRAFIGKAPLYCSGPGSITSANGDTILFPSSGWVDLSSYPSFEEGIYTLNGNYDYAGSIIPINGSNSADVEVGLVASVGDQDRIISYDGTRFKSGSSTYNDLKIGVIYDGDASKMVSISTAMKNYYDLMQTMKRTIAKASNAANAVWNIFDDAGSSTAYITTLLVPDVYSNMNLTAAQQKIITIMAMDYAAQWYGENKGSLVKGGLQLTGASMQLFCRGDISMTNGKLYENVIFTPLFYKDTTVVKGENEFNTNGFVVIWGEADDLASWDMTSSENPGIVAVGGYNGQSAILDVYEMKFDDDMVNSVTLCVNKVNQVDPEEMDYIIDPLPPVKHNNMEDYVKYAMLAIAAVLSLMGAYTRRFDILIIGLAIGVAAFFLAGPIASLLDWFGINDWVE